MHPHARVYKRICIHKHRHTYIHIHTYRHAPIHAYMHTHIHTHAYAHVCTDKKISATTPQRVKQYHRRTYASTCICMHRHTYEHLHICAQPAASVFADVYVGVKTHLCNAPAHALVPKTPVKCMQHSLQKNAHIHIPTHIRIRIHMYTNTHSHAWHCPHAEALILRPTIYAQI